MIKLRPTFCAMLLAGAFVPATQAASLNINLLDTYETSIFDDSAAEIVAYSAVSQKFFVTNSANNAVDVLQMDGSNNVTLAQSISLQQFGGGPNSVSVSGNVVAVAVEALNKQSNGTVEFFDATTYAHLNTLTVGALPDMLTFTSDGSKLIVANEGEPSDDYATDPEGSISVIDMTDGAANLDAGDVTNISFTGLLPGDIDASTRIFGPGASIAQDLEPEYIAVDPIGEKAYAVMQENNALMIIDLATNTIDDLVGFGFKDHSAVGNEIDTSDKDGVINITTRPVYGMYQPDALASYRVNGQTYLVSANEGDAREYIYTAADQPSCEGAGHTWDGDGDCISYAEESRVKDLMLDPTAFPNAAALQDDNEIGRLTVTLTNGDIGGDSDYDELYAYGARSFSIWDASGNQVWDSGDGLAQIVATEEAAYFNSTNDDNTSFENRSDNKGTEPEAATVAEIDGRFYAFIGLERQSAIAVYDVTDPQAPVYDQYVTNRNWAQVEGPGSGGDMGPEGIIYIPAGESPNGQALMVVTNEVSGSTSFYSVDGREAKSDIDNDKEGDLVFRNSGTGDVTTWLLDDATKGTATYIAQYTVGDVVAVVDIDNDSDADILLQNASNSVVTVWEMENGLRNNVFNLDFQAGYSVVGHGDFDNDGDNDLVLEDGSNNVSVWIVENSSVTSKTWLGSWAGHSVAATADVDNDGDDDIVTFDASGNVNVIGMQAGNKTGASWIGQWAGRSVVGIGDADNDGDDDIYMAGASGSDVMVVEMESGAKVAGRWLGVWAGTAVLAIDDIDNDGDDDLIQQNSGTGSVQVVEINAAAKVGASWLGNLAYTLQGTVDADADGDADIVLQDGSGNVALIELENGAKVGGAKWLGVNSGDVKLFD